MMFGGQTSEVDGLSIMNHAVEQGVNFFDTANGYNQGESERIVGKGLKGRRHDIFLATKVYGQMGTNPNDRGLSRRNIRWSVEESLRRLDTDYIDIYYLHAPDYETPLEESLESMNTLVKAGKVRYVAVSNHAAWQIADMLHICDKRNYVAPLLTQNVYNPITRGIEAELVPFLAAHHIGMVIYNPIAAGLLTGKYKAEEGPTGNTRFANNAMYYNRYWNEENFAAVDKLLAIAKASGISILELAMRWCISFPYVTSVISGVSRLEQLTQNIASVEGGPLDTETLAACDEVWRALAGSPFKYNR